MGHFLTFDGISNQTGRSPSRLSVFFFPDLLESRGSFLRFILGGEIFSFPFSCWGNIGGNTDIPEVLFLVFAWF